MRTSQRCRPRPTICPVLRANEPLARKSGTPLAHWHRRWILAINYLGERGSEGGAADKAANLARWKSLCRQLPVFGRLAYPVRAEATKHVLPGCKSLGCPSAREQTSSCASASDGVRSDS